MEVLLTAFILALFIQLLTERFKEFISDRKTKVVALLIGVILCLVYQAGILQMLGLIAITVVIPTFIPKLGGLQINLSFIDYMLTGIAISGGASKLYDFGKTLIEIIMKAKGNDEKYNPPD